MLPTTIRLDDHTRAAVVHEAARRGISLSEYIRIAVIAQIAWDQALRAVSHGAQPDELDHEQLLRHLGTIAKKKKPS